MTEKELEDIPAQCVDGSCPMALSEEYEEYGIPLVHSCKECVYHNDRNEV